MVRRTRDAQNRRRVLVTATDAARTVEQDIYLPVGAAGAQALGRYDKIDSPRSSTSCRPPATYKKTRRHG